MMKDGGLSKYILSIKFNLISNDPRSVTCNNIRYLNKKVNQDILTIASWKVKMLLPIQTVPVSEYYRISLLNSLLDAKIMKDFTSLNIDRTQCIDMINSLCKT